MLKQSFEYLEPVTLDEALEMKASDSSAVYLAGGTDVVPLMKYDLLFPKTLISLERLKELSEIELRGDCLHIGGMARLHKLARRAEKISGMDGLARAARMVASPQIRRIGTVAGNLLQEKRCFYYNQTTQWRQGIETCIKDGGDICHQAPAKPYCCALYYSDLAPAFMAAGAKLKLYRSGGYETVPVEWLYDGDNSLGDGMIVEIQIPEISTITGLFFQKYAVRGSIDFPLANAAIAYRVENCDVRIVMGAMTPAPVFLEQTAKELSKLLRDGKIVPAEIYDSALAEARSLMKPIREAGVTPAVKQDAMRAVQDVIRQLANMQSCIQ